MNLMSCGAHTHTHTHARTHARTHAHTHARRHLQWFGMTVNALSGTVVVQLVSRQLVVRIVFNAELSPESYWWVPGSS